MSAAGVVRVLWMDGCSEREVLEYVDRYYPDELDREEARIVLQLLQQPTRGRRRAGGAA